MCKIYIFQFNIFFLSLYETFPERRQRTAMVQAGYQAAGLGTSLAIAIIGGLITGQETKHYQHVLHGHEY